MSEEAGILKSKPSLKNKFPHVEHKRSQLQGDENLFFPYKGSIAPKQASQFPTAFTTLIMEKL